MNSIFNSKVKSVLLYGCETWKVTNQITNKLQTFINCCLRRILGTRWPETIRNSELWEVCSETSIEKQVKRRKWRWIGHTLRKEDGSIEKEALDWNPQGERKWEDRSTLGRGRL